MADQDRRKEVKEFLEAEYKAYWDFLRYQYDVRDKYVQLFMAALGVLGGLFGAISEIRNLPLVAGVGTFVLTVLSIFTFFKVLYQKKGTTESKKMLNGIRGRLIAIRVEIDDFEKIILPRDPNSVRYLGGDITILSFLAAITALSAGILAKVLFYGDVPHFNRLPFSSCKTILAPLLAITIFVTLIMTWVSLSIKWEREWDHNYWPRYWPCCFEPVLKKIGFLKGDAQSTIHRGDPGWESP